MPAVYHNLLQRLARDWSAAVPT